MAEKLHGQTRLVFLQGEQTEHVFDGPSKAVAVFFKVRDEDYREPDGLTYKQRGAQGASAQVHSQTQTKFGWISEKTGIRSHPWLTELGFRLVFPQQLMLHYNTVNISRRHASKHMYA